MQAGVAKRDYTQNAPRFENFGNLLKKIEIPPRFDPPRSVGSRTKIISHNLTKLTLI